MRVAVVIENNASVIVVSNTKYTGIQNLTATRGTERLAFARLRSHSPRKPEMPNVAQYP